MADKLESDVKRRVENYLISKGQNIEDLTEGQLTELYWNMIRENIAEEERTTVTTYSPEDDEDDEVTDAVKRADDEDVTYNDDGTISVKEEDIIEMVREAQNPVMSKSELIQEMTRQIISEDNQYEEDLESGNNDYARYLDADSIRDIGRELYGDIKSAADEKFGGNANFNRASMEMARSLQNILMFEQDKKEELQEEAVALIREEYPALTEDTVDIDAQITGHPQLGGRMIDKGNVQQERGNTPPPEGYTEEELKDEVTKRRLINGMTHGAARKGQNLYHMAGEKLNRINPNVTQDYSKVMAANDFLYWAMDRDTIKQQNSEGIHAGNVRIVIQEGGKPKIIAQGMTFSFLLHELVKGVMELISTHGRHENYEVHKYVTDKTDTLEAEPDDIRLGTGIWEKVSRFVDIDDGNHKALFLQKLVTKPADEFVRLMKGLVRGDRDSVQRIQEIANEASHELREEEYGDAMGDYDEKTEPTGSDYDDGFPDPEGEEQGDPELDRLLGNSSDEEEEGEDDYANMSKRELQSLMDDALDRGDFELAAQIGPHLH